MSQEKGPLKYTRAGVGVACNLWIGSNCKVSDRKAARWSVGSHGKWVALSTRSKDTIDTCTFSQHVNKKENTIEKHATLSRGSHTLIKRWRNNVNVGGFWKLNFQERNWGQQLTCSVDERLGRREASRPGQDKTERRSVPALWCRCSKALRYTRRRRVEKKVGAAPETGDSPSLNKKESLACKRLLPTFVSLFHSHSFSPPFSLFTKCWSRR